MPWGSIETVGDQSQYVSQVVGHVRTVIPLLRGHLSSVRKYFVNFCHKFAKYVNIIIVIVIVIVLFSTFIPVFITHVYKCKPISTIAAEQVYITRMCVLFIIVCVYSYYWTHIH